jgi:hypothetical protein
MTDLIKEEIVAPTIEAAIAKAVEPASVVTPAAVVAKSGAECTRDTRGEAECAVKDCENCN